MQVWVYGVYVKKGSEGNQLLICLYVDDLIVTGSDMNEIEAFKSQMIREFEMSDLGKLTYFPGMEFTEDAEGLVMHQMKYASDILKRFNMMNCNPSSSPAETNVKLMMNEDEERVNPTLFKQIVGSLRYLCNSRPDIAYAVGIISRFMSEPRCAKKQPVVALSTCESEYIAGCMAACQAIWLENILKEMEIELADIFTKALKVDRFIKLRSLIRMKEVET
ncbi:uncharacterized mitochondrial protein AtMg00810-like [Medicago truncatula]|uniref:uncharacterized mitochondrial protein AtMg00810-like n=1 Tax=Medicago truncatula TaxID=3880 RepID=UPI001967438A|nr:uncharacterized mitochondrial protein AtMg00810-like [Medicago truncatula]